MAGPFRLYFDAWPPDNVKGDSLGEISDARDKRIQDQHNGIGFGHFVINKHSDQIDLVPTGTLIRARIVAGGPFDYDDARYVFAFYLEDMEGQILSKDGDGGEDWTRQGRGIIAVLDRLIWWYESFITDDGSSPLIRKDHWHFPEGDEIGHILQRMVSEWNGRPGAGPYPTTISRSFDQTTASGGGAWDDIEGEYDIPIGESYLKTIDNLIEANIDVYMSPAFVLSAWNEDGRGDDKTADIVFRKGWNIREAANKSVHAPDRATRALVEGKDNEYAVGTDAQTAANESGVWGRRETFVQFPRTKNHPFLQRAGKRALKRLRKRGDGPPTIGVEAYDDVRFVDQGDGLSPEAFKDLVPWTDYGVADLVKVHIPDDYTASTQQIVEIALTDDDAGWAQVTLTFDDVPFNASTGSGNGLAGGTGSGGGGGKCDCPPQRPHPPFCAADPGDTLLKFFNANDAGGDAENWTGLLANQGGSGDGAAGTDWYYYKSNSPRQYQRMWAVSAGDLIRIEGFLGCRSATGGGVMVAFCNGSVGDEVTGLNTIESHVMATNPAHHTHADEWTLFTAGPYTAPVGTTAIALGVIGGKTADFDEVGFYGVATAPTNDEFCVPEGSYDPNDPYDAPSGHNHDGDYATIVHNHGPDDLNIAWKEPVRAATTANGTLATAYENGDTIDGVTLATGDRILLKDQTTGADNGIYEVQATGAPVRVVGFDDDNDALVGAMVRVTEGTANGDKVFGLTTNAPIVIGTTSLAWAEMAGGGGSSGHTIKEDGTPLTARAGLNFGAGIIASDDAGNNETDVALDYGEAGDISTQAFGDAAAAGATGEVADAGHKHGMMADPVTGHTAAGDPHPGYVLESVFAAKGDLLGASANDTPSLVAAGSEGQIPVQRAAATPGVAFETQYTVLTLIIGNGVAVIPTGIKGYVPIEFNGEIVSVRMGADVSGSAVLDIWNDTHANYPPTVADTITASAKPTISATTKSLDTTLTGWSKTVDDGDWLGFNIDSCSSIKQLTVSVKIKRT